MSGAVALRSYTVPLALMLGLGNDYGRVDSPPCHVTEDAMPDRETPTFTATPVSLIRLQQFSRTGSLVFVVACAAAQVRQPNRPLATPVSAYLAGPFALWLHLVFAVFAVAVILFGRSIKALIPRRRATLAAGLFHFCALCILVTAFSAGPPLVKSPSVPQLVHTVHVFSAIFAFVFGLLGMATLTRVLWHDRILNHARGLVSALILGCFMALALDPWLPAVHGALEKLAIVCMITWQLLITPRLIAACDVGTHASDETSRPGP